MKPASQDLRERAIVLIQAGKLTQVEIAEILGISVATLERWWQRWRETGSVTALPHAGGTARVLRDGQAFIRAEVKKQPDVTLVELCERVAVAKSLQANPSMMCRELQRMNLPRKKSRSMIASAKRNE
jgi:transposase